MRRCATLLCLLAAVFVSSSHSAERPSFVGETLLPEYASGYWRGRGFEPQELWQRALIEMHLFTPPADNRRWVSEDCRYSTALEILQQIRSELGESNTYQKTWAANQARVFTACELRAEQAKPIEPAGEGLPERAASDYLYQLASWYFYRGKPDQALPLYEQAEAVSNAPIRGVATYMTLRSMAAQGRVDEAYAKAENALKQPNLSTRELIANFRFILMSRSNHYREASAELAGQHLTWLLKVIEQSPEKAADIERSVQDMHDATEQLGYYFIKNIQGSGVDWWLQPDAPPHARQQSVQLQAKTSELVDWLQARAAFNAFAGEWLWALHQPDADYWKQNQNIVQHAWKRWQESGHAEWLGIAVSRVHPKDPLAEQILSSSEAQLTGNWKGETQDYRQWLYDLWTNSLRLHIGRDDLPGAIVLVQAHADYENLLAGSEYSSKPPPEVYSRVLRWLVYQGKFDEARRWLAVLLEKHPKSYGQWRTLLATTWEETYRPTLRNNGASDYNTTDNSFAQWEAILQVLPAHRLNKLAEFPGVQEYYRPALARAALTRVILLEKDQKTLDDYAASVAKLEPELRELVLQSAAKREHSGYVDLLLQVPRMRPLPLVEYENGGPQSSLNYNQPKSPTAIDTFNHNDNNWWCRVNPQNLEDQVFEAVKILPAPMPEYFNSKELEQQSGVSAFLHKQRELVAAHPYHQKVDKDELLALASIPAAPQYLSESVNARERLTHILPTRSTEAQNEHAASLSRAIRVTRYGCQRNGSHAAYSKKSFELLKTYYPKTLWAQATPFWFGCEHFRGGCPVEQKDPPAF